MGKELSSCSSTNGTGELLPLPLRAGVGPAAPGRTLREQVSLSGLVGPKELRSPTKRAQVLA